MIKVYLEERSKALAGQTILKSDDKNGD